MHEEIKIDKIIRGRKFFIKMLYANNNVTHQKCNNFIHQKQLRKLFWQCVYLQIISTAAQPCSLN